MSKLPDDMRLAARRLRRSPGFTLLAVASLALAIGANSAVFRLVDAVLFARPPFPDPERVVRLWEERPSRGWSRFGVSAPAFVDWREDVRSLAALAAYTRRSANLAGPDRPQRVEVIEATADVFSVFGLVPSLGRPYHREEETAGRDAVAVLAFDFWRDALASDPAIVGRTLVLDGVPHVVTGVLPPAARAAFDGAPIWRPLVIGDDTRRGARWLEVVARVRAGTDVRAARAELEAVASGHARQYPETNEGWTTALVPLREARAEDSRALLIALWAAAGLVLLIACANIAGLMIARRADREGEMAVRAALGAGPAQLARLAATESLMIAALGGGAGLLLAAVLGRVVAAVVGGASAEATPLVDLRLLAFTALATLVTGLAFGVAPAVGQRRAGVQEALRAAGRGATPSGLGARRVLVGLELAVAVALISAAGLLVRSVGRLLAVDPGFDPRGVLAWRVAPPQSRPLAGETEDAFIPRYLAERDRMAAFYDRLLDRLRALPGVQAAGAVNRLPLTGRWWTISFTAEGQPEPPAGEKASARGRVVTPGYFAAMGIRLRAGRVFDARDVAGAPAVALVSESLARRVWPGEDPVGSRLVADERPVLVVGVVADVRLEGLDAEAPQAIYVPFAQATFGLFPDWGLDMVVRSATDPAALAAAVRREVEAVDPTLPVFALRPLEDVVAASLARRRVAMSLLAAFATLAAVLSAVGLYGVVSQSARRRTQEIAVRVALGARRRDVGGLILKEGLVLALAGGALGLATALAAGRLLSTLLFGVGPHDVATLVGSSLLLGVIAVGASLAPALTAARADPLVALRDQR